MRQHGIAKAILCYPILESRRLLAYLSLSSGGMILAAPAPPSPTAASVGALEGASGGGSLGAEAEAAGTSPAAERVGRGCAAAAPPSASMGGKRG